MQYFLPSADFITKIDTLEGKTLFTVCHFEKHIIDNKTQFGFGIYYPINNAINLIRKCDVYIRTGEKKFII